MMMEIVLRIAEMFGFLLSYCLLIFITNFVSIKTKSEKTTKFGEIIRQAVATSVTYVNQTLVEKLKKEGVFNISKQKEALESALEHCQLLIDNETTEYIKTNYGDSVAYLKTLIEAEVKKQKSNI